MWYPNEETRVTTHDERNRTTKSKKKKKERKECSDKIET